MVLIQDQGLAGISFWYPMTEKGAVRSARVIPWESYKRWLPARAAINVALLALGVLLLARGTFPDSLYDVYAAVVFIVTVTRIRGLLPTQRISLTRTTSLRLVPLAGIDYCGTFVNIGLMQLVFGNQPDSGILGGIFELIAPAFIFFGMLPLAFALAFALGVGRFRAR